MEPAVGQRIRRLLTNRDDVSMEMVVTSNGVAAIAVAVLAWLELGLPLGWSVALVPVTFVFLAGCLLFRPTVWITVALGSTMIGLCGALVGAGLAEDVHRYGRWLGAGIGFLFGAGVSGWTYLRVAKAARSAQT